MLVPLHRRKQHSLRFVQTPVVAFLSATVLFACKTAPTTPEAAPQEQVAADPDSSRQQLADKEPVVTIDGEVILTRGELNAQLTRIRGRYEATPGSHPITPQWLDQRRSGIIADTVEGFLLDSYIQKEGIPMPNTDEVLEALRAFNPHIFANDEIFERYLLARHLNRADFLERERREMAIQAKLKADGALTVTDEEIERYYRSQRERLRAKERVLLSTITYRLPKDAPAAVVQHRLEQLATHRQDILEARVSFEEVARAQSQGIEAAQGGDLGWLQRGDDPALIAAKAEAVIFQTPVDSITQPLRTLSGVQIFWVRDRRRAGVRALDEVHESMRQPLLSQRQRAHRRALIHALRLEHSVVEYDDVIGYEFRDR